MFLLGVSFGSPLFIVWGFVILLSMIAAYPFLIVITGLYAIVFTSNYSLLGFGKDFIRRKPAKVGQGDLALLKETQKVLKRSMSLSAVIGSVFLCLTIVFTFLVFV
jgi:hypothetical protein